MIVNPYHCILLGQYLTQLNPPSLHRSPWGQKKWPLYHEMAVVEAETRVNVWTVRKNKWPL